MKSVQIRSGVTLLGAVVLTLISPERGWSEGPLQPVVLQTGFNNPLATATESLFINPAIHLPFLSMNIGFATDEVFAPDQLFDAFSITLQNLVTSRLAVLATVDAGGLLLLPATPGGVPLDPADLLATPTPFPELQPILTSRSAFHLVLHVPGEFIGQPLNLYFDLFDNLDLTPSFAFYSGIELAPVPEPGSSGILLACGLVWAFTRRFCHGISQ